MTVRQVDVVWVADTETDLPVNGGRPGQQCYVVGSRLGYQWAPDTGWRPASVARVMTSTNVVDLTKTGLVQLMTAPSGPLAFIPFLLVARKVAQSGTFAIPATVSVGSNTPNYDDLAASTTLGSALAVLGVGSGVGAAQVRYSIVGFYDTAW